MMTLLMFIIGILTIIGISRYNESDKLFWKLLVSFVGAYTAACIVGHIVSNNDEQDKVISMQSMPTQVLESAPCMYCTLADVSLSDTRAEKSANPVSKDKLYVSDDSILSEVYVATRGGPLKFDYFDTS